MSSAPHLETRFQQPPGWRWHQFTREGRTIRFGTVSPADTIPDAVVICLQGVREFSEKYFETARWCLDHNLAFWIFDWAGQGKSTRFAKHKRHTAGFNEDIKDIEYFIREYIKHSSVHPDRGRIPHVLLAHSMGANLGLRYMQQYPEAFACAALSAPMLGIKVFEKIPQRLALVATTLARALLGKYYVPGGGDWENQIAPEEKRLTGDKARCAVHNIWGVTDPDLITGDVTYRWLHEAQKSCVFLQNPEITAKIKTPCVAAIPGHEHLVDNTIARQKISYLSEAKILEFPDSYHEILMERDEIRDTFLNAFYDLVKETVINRPHTLKPF